MPFVNRLDSWNFGFGITGRVRREVQSHEAGASGIAGDREGKKVKLPEVRATGSTGDRKEKKVKFLEPPASGITGDRGGKKVKPLEVGASGTTGDREGKKGQPRDGEVSGGKTADTKKKKVTFLLRTDEWREAWNLRCLLHA